MVFLVPLGACSVLGFGGVSVSHQELDGEWSDAAVPGSISEVAWEWTAEGHWGDVEVTPLPRGALVRTARGVVALDGVTGEERWSFTVDDEGVRALTDVSSSGERVHVMYPKEAPDEEVGAADDEEGSVPPVEWRRVVLDGVSGEVVGDFEEPIAPDVEKPGPFNVGVAGDGGVFHLEAGDGLSGAMLSDEDGSELWRTEDLFTCEGSKVHRADRPVVFSDAVVVRAGCGSLDAELIGLDPGDGSVLWHLEGEEAAFLTSERRSVRGAGEVLPVYHDQGSSYQDEQFSERYVFDPVTGGVVGDATGLEEEEHHYLARTLEDGFLVAQRAPSVKAAGYELRRFDGQILATEERAVPTASISSYVLALEDAVVKLESEDPETPVNVAPWGGGDVHRIDLPEPVRAAGYFEARQPEGQFEAVPGAVVLVGLADSQDQGAKVIAFH
ncbi:PQQ-binding-like beta-propeller repeat protein [Nocardiopsis sp. L17-MgMaSL7]|uniref:outer membrane protein assembly factor BamB family protein n=1 Tax=Nocardiopsis sp. L17-MgMaSL7 TaxID=1938893 RepID=UPI000DA051BD|nr:PQQ-binding-like beta-propeller repeat protein [Nocardiopsis sp. L17-MgMaSL7]PWV45502.1 putative pyrroloquinoline-quinone binding quinoprotein [Nocardiopsis sp. L17-MgMaSL7]